MIGPVDPHKQHAHPPFEDAADAFNQQHPWDLQKRSSPPIFLVLPVIFGLAYFAVNKYGAQSVPKHLMNLNNHLRQAPGPGKAPPHMQKKNMR
mmetsp:Transcript_37712/g.62103  ORF Transcript_37712/g.62103 Transcript_37712/m.62103 type:complete len:93 (+) Transcript_37712:30-308(+)